MIGLSLQDNLLLIGWLRNTLRALRHRHLIGRHRRVLHHNTLNMTGHPSLAADQ